MLHAIHAMFKKKEHYDNRRFYKHAVSKDAVVSEALEQLEQDKPDVEQVACLPTELPLEPVDPVGNCAVQSGSLLQS